jgi:hypothetical protein
MDLNLTAMELESESYNFPQYDKTVFPAQFKSLKLLLFL